MTDDGGFDGRTGRRGVRFAHVLVAIALLVSAPTAPAAGTAANQAAGVPTGPAFVVALDADGSARVTLAVAFDLTTDDERRAFEALRGNTTARERRTERFATRMRAIATRAENESGRAMAIDNPAIAFAERDDTGIVALSVTWDGLAAREGDRLVLRGPFDNGFDVDRRFRVVGPDGYELATATPSATTTRNAATWDAGTEFDGFEVVFAPASSGIPGFGFGATLVAGSAVAALLVRRRDRQ